MTKPDVPFLLLPKRNALHHHNLISMKRVATIQVPESERVFHLRNSPHWVRVPKVPESMRPDVHRTKGHVSPKQPPAHVEGKWSNRIWTLKHQLDEPPYVSMWNVYKQYTNDYERIHVSSNRSRMSDNVAAYLPLSRSYFKMWELLKDFGLLGGHAEQPSLANTAIRTAHLAEGPGGFIEAVCRFRKATASDTARRNDMYYGITLKPTRRDVPGWTKSIRLLREYTQIHRHHGADGTGCLYKIANIHKLVADVGRNSCTLVTGDGGIDFSVDFALQEPLSLRLLTAQIYAGLLLLHPGKAFLCKFFDMHEPATHELLWILATVFDKIHIVKPVTSRLANSERYIVGVGYRGCPEPLEKLLCKTLMQWRSDCKLVTIMQRPVPQSFVDCVTEYNEWYAEQQHKSIQACLRLIDMAVAVPHPQPRLSESTENSEHTPSYLQGDASRHVPSASDELSSVEEDVRHHDITSISDTKDNDNNNDNDSTPQNTKDAEAATDDGWSTCTPKKRRMRAKTGRVDAREPEELQNTEVGWGYYDDTPSVPPHRVRRRPTQNMRLESELERIVVQQRERARQWCEKYEVAMI